MPSLSAQHVLVEVCFPNHAFSVATVFLRWLEPRLVPLLNKLEPECPSQPLLWQNRCIKIDQLKGSYKVYYAISFTSESDAIDGLLENYAAYLESQPMVRDNSRLLEIHIKRSEQVDMPHTILDRQEWSTMEAMKVSQTGVFGNFNAVESDEVDMQPVFVERTRDDMNPTVPTVNPSKKFRTEREVMNRIRHDPDFSTDDYLVGYEDRFTGIMEMPLSNWKADTTEDEFIPLHRIVHFRKKDTQEIVWDRPRRIDLIWM